MNACIQIFKLVYLIIVQHTIEHTECVYNCETEGLDSILFAPKIFTFETESFLYSARSGIPNRK
jgi:hypothetical protein